MSLASVKTFHPFNITVSEKKIKEKAILKIFIQGINLLRTIKKHDCNFIWYEFTNYLH